MFVLSIRGVTFIKPPYPPNLAKYHYDYHPAPPPKQLQHQQLNGFLASFGLGGRLWAGLCAAMFVWVFGPTHLTASQSTTTTPIPPHPIPSIQRLQRPSEWLCRVRAGGLLWAGPCVAMFVWVVWCLRGVIVEGKGNGSRAAPVCESELDIQKEPRTNWYTNLATIILYT